MSTPLVGPLAPSADWTRDLTGATQDAHPPRARPRRTWFGWSATSLPIAPLLLLGILLGPHGLSILTPAALAAIDPALPVALAALGAVVGLMPSMQGHVVRALGSAALAGGFTCTILALTFAAGALAVGQQSRAAVWLLPLILGISAATSLIVPVRRPSKPLSWTGVAIESETFMAVMAGGLLLVFARQATLLPSLLWLAQACAIVGLIGFAGWILPRNSASEGEQRVFAVATLLLVGGAADYLSFSALAAGLGAGLLWTVCGGPSRERLERDLLYAMHPLTALVLVVAGARVEPTALSIGLAVAYVCVRLIARTGVSILSARLHRARHPGRRPPLIEPGVFGVAFVLNAFRALGPDLSLALSIVVMGTLLTEVVALAVTPRGELE